MADRIEHEDVMELAVQLACSFLSSSHSGTTNAEDLIFSYYQQIRAVEERVTAQTAAEAREGAAEEAVRAAA